MGRLEPFNKMMIEYSSAIMEVETRLKVLNAMFSEEYKRNPFESIKSRLKKTDSIYKKLERKGYPVTIENIREYHLILSVPVFLPNEKKYIKAEVQFRTIAMDFWASLEHKLRYKKDINNTEEIEQQLKACADSIEALDYQMQEIRNKIDHPAETALGGNT